MASKKIVEVARPILSQNREEARRRVIRLYRCWYRNLDFVFLCFRSPSVPLTVPDMRKKLRQEFDKNRHHTDLRVIDLLIFKGQNDLKEVSELWSQECHIMGSWFKDTIEPKPKTFLSKFFSGTG